jgi:hypothetical protein
MANIRIIPIAKSTLTVEDLAVINSSTAINAEESVWKTNSDGSLTVSSMIPARSGAWVSRFNLEAMDTPPFIEWRYSETAPDNAVSVVQQVASRVTLKVSNIDLQPNYNDIYPDTFWVKNGLDLIPRSV